MAKKVRATKRAKKSKQARRRQMKSQKRRKTARRMRGGDLKSCMIQGFTKPSQLKQCVNKKQMLNLVPKSNTSSVSNLRNINVVERELNDEQNELSRKLEALADIFLDVNNSSPKPTQEEWNETFMTINRNTPIERRVPNPAKINELYNKYIQHSFNNLYKKYGNQL
jgi:hypothetical protein